MYWLNINCLLWQLLIYCSSVIYLFRSRGRLSISLSSHVDISICQFIKPSAVFLHSEECVDILQQIACTIRNQSTQLSLSERLIDERSGKSVIQSCIIAGFHDLGDHNIGLAFCDQARDLFVGLMNSELRIGKILLCKLLVQSAGVLHHTHIRLIDGIDARIFFGIFGSAENRLAVSEVSVGHKCLLLTLLGDGDAGNGNIEFSVDRILEKSRPCCRHKLDLHIERFCQVFCKLNIESLICPCLRVKVGHGTVVAGRAYQENATFLNFRDFASAFTGRLGL